MRPTDADRPKLYAYRRARGLTKVVVGGILGVSTKQVARYELPFEDPRRQVPGEAVIARIHAWTAGEITPADFYHPALTREAAHG